jgi:hypothetical protein
MKEGITCENNANTIANDDFLVEDDLPLKSLAEMWRNSLHFQDVVLKTNTRQTTLLDYFNMIQLCIICLVC